MKWELGRLWTGYRKCKLLTGLFPVPFDLYLLHFPEGSYIPAHTDPVPGRRHFRLNIVLRKANKGGFFYREQELKDQRIHFFRPDESEHFVTRVMEGDRYVLSLGWTLIKKDY